MKPVETIINRLRVAMTDARQNESHFESWMILNEAICDAIDALAEQPAQQQEPGFYGRVAARLSKRVKELEARQQEPVAVDQIASISKRHNWLRTCDLCSAYMAGFRDAEAAHGITGEQK